MAENQASGDDEDIITSLDYVDYVGEEPDPDSFDQFFPENWDSAYDYDELGTPEYDARCSGTLTCQCRQCVREFGP